MWHLPILLLSIIMTSSALQADEIDDFQRGAVYKALRLQEQINLNLPIARIQFPTTHNSYNSSAYRSAVRYVDPNQRLSIYDQLRIGVRAIEFDVHHFLKADGWPWRWKRELLLCHGRSNHLGCGTFDRRLTDGLKEVRRFLQSNEAKDSVIVLYIEDHSDGQYRKMVQALESTIGQWVYRPSQGCQGIPMSITQQQILNAGKQVLVMGGRDVCSSNSGWSTWAFAGVGSYRSGSYPTINPKQIVDGNCFAGQFDRNFYRKHWMRTQEDRTMLGGIAGDQRYIDAPLFSELVDCGTTLIGLDDLRVNDERLERLLWRWAANEPNDYGSGEDCAEHRSDGRLNDIRCDVRRNVACKLADDNWFITSEAVNFAEAEALCLIETDGQANFVVPVNGYDNKRLTVLKRASNINSVWVNLSDAVVEGKWRPAF